MTVTDLPTSTSSPATAVSPTSARTDDRHAVRSRHDDVRAIPTVIGSEWIKLSSIRASKAILALTIVANVALAWAVGAWVTEEVLTASKVFVFPAIFTAVLAAVAGILIFTTEAQHGTLGTSLTAQPERWVIAVSKMITTTAVGLILAAAGMVAAFGGALASGLDVGDPSTMAGTAGNAVVFTALAGLIGLGVGMVARHSAAAISGLLVWWFVAENLLHAVLPATVSRFLPFDAGYRLLDVGSDFDTPANLAAQLQRPQLAMVFGTYAVIALAAGTVLLHRRDTN
jgi:ABC-type transport system involved in multi-copper enzyme maturation permease subunit